MTPVSSALRSRARVRERRVKQSNDLYDWNAQQQIKPSHKISCEVMEQKQEVFLIWKKLV